MPMCSAGQAELLMRTAEGAIEQFDAKLEVFKDRVTEQMDEVQAMRNVFSRLEQSTHELRAADAYKAHDIQELKRSARQVETRLGNLYHSLDRYVGNVRWDVKTYLDHMCASNNLQCWGGREGEGEYSGQAGACTELPDIGRVNQVSRMFRFVLGCLTSQQHASASQGRICSDSCTCCHTETEDADPTFSLTHSILTPGQPVQALTLQRQAPSRVASGVPILKSLAWLDPEKSPRSSGNRTLDLPLSRRTS